MFQRMSFVKGVKRELEGKNVIFYLPHMEQSIKYRKFFADVQFVKRTKLFKLYAFYGI